MRGWRKGKRIGERRGGKIGMRGERNLGKKDRRGKRSVEKKDVGDEPLSLIH
jgi:hypothetical protein